MKMLLRSSRRLAFTLKELIVVMATVAVLFSLYLTFISNHPRSRVRGTRIRCVSNLKQVGFAFLIFANENDGKFPFEVLNAIEPYTGTSLYHNASNVQAWMHFQVLSNEFQNTKILSCPADSMRGTNSAEDFLGGVDSLSASNRRNLAASYFVGLGADETKAQAILGGDRNLALGQNFPPVSSAVSGGVRMPASSWWSQAAGHALHTNVGNIVLADGSVQQVGNRRLSEVLRLAQHQYGTNANLFLFPQ